MRFFKKVIAMTTAIMFATIALFNDSMEVQAAKQYGMSYDSSECYAEFKTGGEIKTYDSNNAVIGKMYYTIAKMRAKTKNDDGTYENIVVVRMQMDPQKAVKTGTQTRYGVSEYLKVTANLPTCVINDWSPKNAPEDETWNIGIEGSASKDGPSVGVSASTDVVIKQLDFEADVQISNKRATFIFDYKPSKGYYWSSSKNKYVRNSSMQYAMVSYTASSKNNSSMT